MTEDFWQWIAIAALFLMVWLLAEVINGMRR